MYTYIESLNSTEARLNLTHTPPTYFVNVVDTAGPAETVQWALPPLMFYGFCVPLSEFRSIFNFCQT